MFHRHFDDYVHHSHGGPGPHGFGRGPFSGAGVRTQQGPAAGRAACSTAASSGS